MSLHRGSWTARLLLGLALVASAISCSSAAQPAVPSATVAPSDRAGPLTALIGATLIDVSQHGNSSHDISDSVVLVGGERIIAVGTAASLAIPRNARRVDVRGKFLIPGLVDGFTGLNSQAQANATLYMGVTTVVGSGDDRRGLLKFDASPTPHLYLADSAGSTDDYSLLIGQPEWSKRLKDGDAPHQLTIEETRAQLDATARRGTRVVWIGHDIDVQMARFIIAEAHQRGMVSYGEVIAASYDSIIDAGVDSLLHATRYELGLVSKATLQQLETDPEGKPQDAAYDELMRLDASATVLRDYGAAIAAHHVALMPTFSLEYLTLPGHRNLWQEPAAAILDPAGLHLPPDRMTGDAQFKSDSSRAAAVSFAMHFFAMNRTIRLGGATYLAASGANALGSMPGISMHTELELLVRVGLTARQALAAATSNYADQFGWHELGAIESGRRADLLVLDHNPVEDISASRSLHAVMLSGRFLDRAALLRRPAAGLAHVPAAVKL